MKYLEHAQMAFSKVDEGIYLVIKHRFGFADDYAHDIKRGDYVTAAKVVDILNNVEKVAIFTNRISYIHSNFTLGDEQQ